jgi:hypothetical protein
VNARAAVGAIDIQLAGDHRFLEARLGEQPGRLVHPRQSHADRAAGVHRKGLAVPIDQHGELAVDLAADVVLRRRDLFLDVGAVQRLHPRAGQAAILLDTRQQRRIGQYGG